MLKKITRKLVSWSYNLINILSLPLFLIIYFIIVLILFLNKNKDNLDNALFIGLEHVINKTLVRADQLRHLYTPSFYSFEVRKSPKCLYKIDKISRFVLLDLINFSKLILRKRPKYCEIYFEGNCFRQYYQSALLKWSDTLTIGILRGELYYYHSTMSIVKKWFLIRCLNKVDWIYYRETYMLEILQTVINNQKKIVFDSNKVKVCDMTDVSRDEKIVLFLNGFKKWRRLDIIIDAIPEVLNSVPDAKFILVGARSDKELSYYHNLIPEKYLDKVQVGKWTKNSRTYYERASIFVLPADLVYLNFSLLEAMERGVPPIVADVKDAEKIINHNLDGLIVNQNKEGFSEGIIKLLSQEELRLSMAKNARKKIERNFNDKERMESIIQRIEKKYNG